MLIPRSKNKLDNEQCLMFFEKGKPVEPPKLEHLGKHVNPLGTMNFPLSVSEVTTKSET